MRNALFAGSTRFGEFQVSLGIATNILAARLEHLIESGVMERVVPAEGEPAAYALTERGRDLLPALIALTDWGDKWAAPQGEPVLYRHADGHHAVHTRVFCDLCGSLDTTDDVEALPGPGMPESARRRLLERHHARRTD